MNRPLFYMMMIFPGLFPGYNDRPMPLGHVQKVQHRAAAVGYFTVKLKKGAKLANIYSRTIAFSGDDIKPEVYRVSGSSRYQLIGDSLGRWIFKETDLYDGRPESTGISGISLTGKGSYNGKEFENTSASGLLYSELVWGPVPKQVHTGSSWKVKLSKPWELGGAGWQTVTVISTDPQHAAVTLKREGDSDGPYDGDMQQVQVTTNNNERKKMNIKPGHSHWVGYTTFRNGVVISDELLVTRPVTLTSDGMSINAQQREYILLNAMP